MKKKTKRALGIGAASAAAFAAGIIISATPAYAEENCSCEPGNHAEDCACGCGDADAALKEAEGELGAAHTGVTFTEREESYSKQYAEAAAKEEKEAEEKKDASKAAYDKAVADEEASVKAQQDQAKSDEQAKSDALMQANVAEGQAETAANEAQKAADDAKEQLDTAKGYKDGTLPIEDTDEYKKAQETQADLDKKTGELDAAQKAADDAKADADSKKTALDVAQADYDSKKKAADDKQAAQDSAQEAKDAAQTAQDANEQALNKAAEEKDAADKDVTDKTAQKESADKAQADATKAYEDAVDSQEKAEADASAAKKDLDDYKKEYEQKQTSASFFEWLKDNSNAPQAIKDDAARAYRVITDTMNDSDKAALLNDGSTYAEGVTPLTYDDIIGKTTNVETSNSSANHLEMVKKALDLIDIGNARRAGDSGGSTFPLNVLPSLMATSEINANYMSAVEFGHTLAFSPLENAAWGYQNDPYLGWYDEEKVNYDSDNGGETGHYETLTGRRGDFTVTGLGRNALTDSQMFSYGEGITTDEFRNLISSYEKPLKERVDELQKKSYDAQAASEQAKAAAETALAKKEAADKAAQDAKAALETAEATQREKHTAYGNAVAAEAKSRNDLQTAQTALDNAKQENEAAQDSLTNAQTALDNAKKEKEAADTALEQADKNLEEKKAAYDKAKETDEAADRVLADLMDVDAKQAVYDTAAANAKEASDAYDMAKKSASDARTAYDEAERALEVAHRLKAEDAQYVKDAKAAYEAALKEYEEKAAVAKEKQEMYETDKEYSQKAAARLVTAQKAYEEAKAAAEAAQKRCEERMVENSGKSKNAVIDPTSSNRPINTKEPGYVQMKGNTAGGKIGISHTTTPSFTSGGTASKTYGGVNASTTTAAFTGDNGYVSVAVYTVLAAAAAAGLGIALKRRKKTN